MGRTISKPSFEVFPKVGVSGIDQVPIIVETGVVTTTFMSTED